MIRPLLRRAGIAALAAAALAAHPAPAAAGLVELGACDDAELGRVFAPWGDPSLYKLAPGGDFEGDHGWRLSGGARVVGDSEPFGVTGRVGDAALSLPAGASAVSPATCVNAAYPTLRAFARSSGGLLGLLPLVKVDLLYGAGLTKALPLPAGTTLPSASWRPSLPMLTSAAVASAVAGGEAPVAIRITSLSGTWRIDDVFVDPLRRS